MFFPLMVPAVGITPSTFVAVNGSASGAAIDLTSASAGNVAVIFMLDTENATDPTGPGGTWTAHGEVVTAASGNVRLNAWSKVLEAGDISSPPTVTGLGNTYVQTITFDGGETVTKLSGQANIGTGNSLTVTGDTKSASSRRIILLVGDADTHTNLGVPTGYTTHVAETITSFRYTGVASVEPGDYTGSNFTITYSSGGTSYQTGVMVLEIT